MDDLIRRQTALNIRFSDAINEDGVLYVPFRDFSKGLKALPSAQPELIEKTAYIRGFEQGRTQGMIDTKAEEVAQPTADVVEIVRCKDCKWWDNDGDAERCTHKYGGMWAKSDGYCSYGERTDV